MTSTITGPLSGAAINPTSRVVTLAAGPNIGTINNGLNGREIILIATGAVVIEHNTGNIRLNQTVPGNFGMAVNSTLHLVFFGGNWLEVGRKP
jgi:hypothetical protein